MEQNSITIKLQGRIDSGNAAKVEQEILAQLEGAHFRSLVLDAGALAYISSAGLRILLRLKKKIPALQIFETTGFTEMMTVEKAYQEISVEGCEVIGEGANGKVYRIDADTVVKTYKNADALAEIQHEREVARLALILGVPTAISYDVVRVGDSYGSVFELLNASSFAKILAAEPEKLDWCVQEYTNLLRGIHGIHVPAGKLPSIKEFALGAVRRMLHALPDAYAEKLERLVEAVPEQDTMIHGDFHTKNIVLVGDEVLLIDMDTLAVGHPIFELMQIYNSFVGFGEYDPAVISRFQGFPAETAREFWGRALRAYLCGADEAGVREVEDKVRCVAYALLIDWGLRHLGQDTESGRETLALWTRELLALLDRLDTLRFTVNGLD